MSLTGLGGRRLHGRLPALALVLALVAACGDPTSSSSLPPVARSPTAAPTATAERSGDSTRPAASATPRPSASAAPGTSTPPTAGPPDPSTTGRILAALASGELDAPTALLYRVYGSAGFDGLPQRFIGTGPTEDLAALKEAVASFAALPAAIQTEIRPFIVRPTDPGSAYHGSETAGSRQGVTLARAGAPLAALPCSLLGWAHQDGSYPFRVWGRCGRQSEGEIARVVADLDRLWPKMVDVMRRPLPDGGSEDEGGSTAIDIYLVDPCKWRANVCEGLTGDQRAKAVPAGPYEGDQGSRRSSGFILMPRGAMAEPVRARADLAHELFHVMQSAFNEDAQYSPRGGLHWFVEASAKWSEWQFVPESASDGVVPWFSQFQGSTAGLQSTDKSDQYAAYPWPLFMAQAQGGPGAIGDAWRGTIFAETDAEMTSAIDGVVSFESKFRDFAVEGWNQELGDAIRPLFPLQAVGDPRSQPVPSRRADDDILLPFQPGAPAVVHTEFIASLASVYRPFEVDAEVRQITIDVSGLAPAASLDVDVLVRVKDIGWERRKLEDLVTRWCLDQPRNDIEEGIVVLSNHDKDPDARIVGTWSWGSTDASCALLQGTLTFERTSSYLEDEPSLPDESRDEHTTASITVMMDGEGTGTGDRGLISLVDAVDGRRLREEDGSRYKVDQSMLATKEMGDCTARFGTTASGSGRFADTPLGAGYVNSISGFLDRTSGQLMLAVVVHYRYRVNENVCDLTTPTYFIVSDAFACMGQFGIVGKLQEVDGGPDRVTVACEDEGDAMGYDTQTIIVTGSLTLFDE